MSVQSGTWFNYVLGNERRGLAAVKNRVRSSDREDKAESFNPLESPGVTDCVELMCDETGA